VTSPTTPSLYAGPVTPALERLARVAQSLGDKLRERVVFIGGSILLLLETDREVFGSPRPTKDVDAVVITVSYTQKGMIEESLRALRFRHDTSVRAHLDRWISPDGVLFDLVSCGDHPGGTGNTHDAFAIETAVSINLPPVIRHASAVGFLTLKCGAYRDRGKAAPLASKDLMDIVALAATRATLPQEMQEARDDIRKFVGAQIHEVLETPSAALAIPSHIRDREPLADDVEQNVMSRLRAIAAL
jgi:hypothetical protein